MARTERGQYRFIVKEAADGAPFLMLDAVDAGIAAFGDAVLTFDLRDGITLAEAEQIACLLREQVTGLSATFFDQALDA